MENNSNYSVFEYLYRDASNWKSWGKLLLIGSFTSDEYAHMEAKLDIRQFFIPEQIGIPPLLRTLNKSSTETTSDDHVWHEYIALRTATIEEIQNGSCWGTTQSLLDRICAVAQWDITQSQAYNALYINLVLEQATLRRKGRNQPWDFAVRRITKL